jgi:hypothetical protein
MQDRPDDVQSTHDPPPDPHAMSWLPCAQIPLMQHPVGQEFPSHGAVEGRPQWPPTPEGLAKQEKPPVCALHASH